MDKKDIVIYDNKEMIGIADNFINNEAKGLVLPSNYDYKGAVTSLYLQCLDVKTSNGQPALEVCTKESIYKTIRDMITKGLNPSKKQCYPIAYAVRDKDTKEILCWELQLQESYFGKKRQAYTNNPDLVENGINAQCIYKGDVFETSIDKFGRKHIVKHEQKFENIKDVNIIGAYAVARFKDGTDMADVMTIEEIKKSWAMSRAGGTVHANFSHEMACKTVSSRLAKQLSNSTDDETIINPKENDTIVIDAQDIIQNSETDDVQESNSVEETEPVLESEPPAIEENGNSQIDELKCSQCEKPITQSVSSYSIKNFGKPLCMNCQKEQK